MQDGHFEEYLKQRLSFWEANAAAALYSDVPQVPHAGDAVGSSDSRPESSLDIGKWAANLWELAGSEQKTPANVAADAKVRSARSYTIREALSRKETS